MSREERRFVVEIKRCENATWQGSIRRVKQEEAVVFRSALELLKIMDGAVGRDAADKAEDSATDQENDAGTEQEPEVG